MLREVLDEEEVQGVLQREWDKYGEDVLREGGEAAEHWRIFMHGTREEVAELKSRLEELDGEA
jgi:hypothetical protein